MKSSRDNPSSKTLLGFDEETPGGALADVARHRATLKAGWNFATLHSEDIWMGKRARKSETQSKPGLVRRCLVTEVTLLRIDGFGMPLLAKRTGPVAKRR